MYQPRTYRRWVKAPDLISFRVVVKETDLMILAERSLEGEALSLVNKFRNAIEDYIRIDPLFLTSLEPIPVTEEMPPVARQMAEAAKMVGVGPMAAVAGAIAQSVGEELGKISPEVIIENGGDNYLLSHHDRVVGIYAGSSPLSGRVGLVIKASEMPVGVCTSSGTVGHSLSFGSADAVTVVSPSAFLADAAATAIGNLINSAEDFSHGFELAKSIPGILGVILIKGDKIGAWGDVELCTIR
jgi:hypothetical protein